MKISIYICLRLLEKEASFGITFTKSMFTYSDMYVSVTLKNQLRPILLIMSVRI